MIEKRFEFTQDHRLLLQHAVVRWDRVEFGAPAIDSKRPYGNSYVIGDIAEILGRPRITKEEAACIHHETEYALQILLQEGRYALGTYVMNTSTGRWEPIEDVG